MEQGLAVLQRDLELGFGVLGVCQAQGSPDPCLGLRAGEMPGSGLVQDILQLPHLTHSRAETLDPDPGSSPAA